MDKALERFIRGKAIVWVEQYKENFEKKYGMPFDDSRAGVELCLIPEQKRYGG